jgi:hypothetical protein
MCCAAAVPTMLLSRCSGRDLPLFDAHHFHLVFAGDSVQYLHRAGTAIVECHFADVARVLVPGGDVVIFNYSYRNDLDADRRDIATLARALRCAVIANGARPYRLWDGAALRMVGNRESGGKREEGSGRE